MRQYNKDTFKYFIYISNNFLQTTSYIFLETKSIFHIRTKTVCQHFDKNVQDLALIVCLWGIWFLLIGHSS